MTMTDLSAVHDSEMMDVLATCIFFGGKDRPINPATLYRGIKANKFPPPVKVGGASRWRRSECVECRDNKLVKERDARIAAAKATQQAEGA
jgi:hypothetical protein